MDSEEGVNRQPEAGGGARALDDVPRKDFFDLMRAAYRVYECVEGADPHHQNSQQNVINGGAVGVSGIDWDELERNPVIKALMESLPQPPPCDASRRGSEGAAEDLMVAATTPTNRLGVPPGNLTSGGGNREQQTSAGRNRKDLRRNSVSSIPRKPFYGKKESNFDPEEAFIDAALKAKLSEILNEGILDSVLPYMMSHPKAAKTSHQPIIKRNSGVPSETKKSTTFSGIPPEQESKEKLSVPSRVGRRKSSTSGGEKFSSKGDGEVEIHVCDEVKGLKKDFKCPQKLLVSKMGYFADVTSGQKLEDMDISVHCDIQIFDWLMRWVKKDSILQTDWPQLDPSNVVPILVSASFLQMDPLLHDCLMFCHSHMSDIVKTNTNLACLNDTILTRLGAMYTNSELEAIKDRKDKIQSRLFCKMIMSLGEPVPETLRGHYASLANLYKCSKCNKLLPRQIADRVPCVPSSMLMDYWGNLLSTHMRDSSWNLSEYIVSLHNELKHWRKVYWRLWGECHFLKCSVCDNYFPVHQMDWCCYHADMPQFFSLEPTKSMCLPVGRYPCCGERAYRFQVLNLSTKGCQFREHCPEQRTDYDIAVLTIYNEFKDIIFMEPPKLIFPERLTRLVARESGNETGKLTGKEVFWWEGLKLAPPRPTLGLLGKLYSGTVNSKIGAINKPQTEQVPINNITRTVSMVQISNPTTNTANPIPNVPNNDVEKPEGKSAAVQSVSCTKNINESKDESSSESDEVEESDSSSNDSSHSEESSPPRSPNRRRGFLRRRPRFLTRRRLGGGGRQWAATLSARSNQDQQRQFEEKAARQMRTLLARKAAAPQSRPMQPTGGVYVRLENEWREANLPPPPSQQSKQIRHLYSAKTVRSKTSK